MTGRHPERERWLAILRAAHGNKSQRTQGNLSGEDVMRRIRAAAAVPPPKDFLPLFETFVWRMAPVTGAAILVCAVIVSQMEIVDAAGAFQLLEYGIEESSALSWVFGNST
jgi:hypothetical protein